MVILAWSERSGAAHAVSASVIAIVKMLFILCSFSNMHRPILSFYIYSSTKILNKCESVSTHPW